MFFDEVKMYSQINEELKNSVIQSMAKNLTVLRAMLHLSQAQLASLIGVSRQTIVLFETEKRTMPWSTYIALLFIFDNNSITKPLLLVMGVYPDELRDFFTKTEE